METLWFILMAFMLTMYTVLDGFDLGIGAIHPFIAKNDEERRMNIQAIGPVWDGNEVWLIASGGVLFFAFPLLYASAFSGFYLPLIMVLWLLMLRGISIEIRNHINFEMWSEFWDAIFALGSGLLALFFGVALGNVVRGVSLGEDGYFFHALWTNFSPTNPQPGILDWYTIMVGLLAVATLIVHGANFLAVKTENALNARARSYARRGWVAMVALTVVTTVATFWIRPQLLSNFASAPWGAIFPLLAIGGLIGVILFNARANDKGAFISSSSFIIGMMASTAFALYPNVLPAVNEANSLTVSNAAASQYGLTVGLVWWSIGMVLAGTYFILIYRMFRGKVKLDEGGY